MLSHQGRRAQRRIRPVTGELFLRGNAGLLSGGDALVSRSLARGKMRIGRMALRPSLLPPVPWRRGKRWTESRSAGGEMKSGCKTTAILQPLATKPRRARASRSALVQYVLPRFQIDTTKF
ncbi:hypothetical protein GCM10027514_41650 [Azotobacter armeniacus]